MVEPADARHRVARAGRDAGAEQRDDDLAGVVRDVMVAGRDRDKCRARCRVLERTAGRCGGERVRSHQRLR